MLLLSLSKPTSTFLRRLKPLSSLSSSRHSLLPHVPIKFPIATPLHPNHPRRHVLPPCLRRRPLGLKHPPMTTGTMSFWVPPPYDDTGHPQTMPFPRLGPSKPVHLETVSFWIYAQPMTAAYKPSYIAVSYSSFPFLLITPGKELRDEQIALISIFGLLGPAPMDADSEMLLMCFRAGRNFFAARDFLGAFGAFGNALSLDPSSFLLLWSFHVALAYYNRSLPPNRAIIHYDGVLEPIRAAAVA
ncbi:hypothetical protein ACLB2K_062510 [Fragaria x ananassa]